MGIRNIGCSLFAIGILLSLNFTVLAGDIHLSVINGDLATTVSLIEKNIDLLNVRDDNGRTPLNLAVESELIEFVEFFIERGADVNLSDIENQSPLHHSAATGSIDITRLLLENGVTTINDTSCTQRNGMVGGWTPLHMAIVNGHPDVVELLLDYGADIEARDGVQRTPLILAAECNNLRVAEILIERHADINAVAIRGYTAILWGTRNQFEEYVDLLITHKAHIAEEDLHRAFQMAAVSGMERLINYAVEQGCNVEELKERDPGLIFPAVAGGELSIVESLVEFGFYHKQQDENGWTLLHYAASEGHTSVVEYLLGLGLSIDARNLKGESAYNLASLKRFGETAEFLTVNGADTSGPQFPLFEGPYMGQKPVGDIPEIFLPGIVSGRDRAHSSITFSPDGLEAYWTEMIPPEGRVAFTHVVEGKWTYPIAVDIDRDPTFSPDSNRLYFIKTRPFKEGETPGGDPDVKEEYWYKERTDTGWSAPVSVGEEVNAIGVHWPCSVDKEGNLFFSEFSKNMYCSEYVDGRYETPILLIEYFNNETLVGRNPFISPEGDYLLFSANDSLHISFKKKDNTWTDRINLGNIINGSHLNGSPRITADGKYLFFLSAGQGRPWGIYWVSTDFIGELRLMHIQD